MEKQQVKTQLNVQIPKSVKLDLEIYAAKTGQNIKNIVSRAITEYIHGE